MRIPFTMKLLSIIICIICSLSFVWGQKSNLDNLDLPDEVMIRYKKAIKLISEFPDSTIYLTTQNLELAIEDSLFWAENLNVRGVAYYYSADYPSALKDYFASLSYYQQKKDTANSINKKSNIALVLGEMGSYSQALKYLIDIERIIEDETKYVFVFSNLGLIYENLEEYEIALEYHQKALRIDSIAADTNELSIDYINVGVQYLKMDSLNLAEHYLKQGEHYARISGNNRHLGLSNLNLGSLAIEKKQFRKAAEYLENCLEIANKHDYNKLVIKAYIDYVDLLGFKLNKHKLAIQKAEIAIQKAKKHQVVGDQSTLHKHLFSLYKNRNQLDNALYHYEMHNKIEDSLEKVNRKREFIAYELEYRFERELLKDSLENAKILSLKDEKLKKQQQEVRRKNTQLSIGVLGGLAFALLSLLLFRRYRLTNKQKHIISGQNEKLEVKNKEISDSISYAQRIQNTILPTLDSNLPFVKDYFIQYIPKDVVSGDFYWIEEKNDTIYIAAADCTGHGVPGAMVSVVCSRALNVALHEENNLEVNQILNRTRTLIVEQFLSKSSNIKDGMDICLISISKAKDDNYKLDFAGANNALMLISKERNSSINDDFIKEEKNGVFLYEIPADKQPVGYSFQDKPFSKSTIKISSGTRIYLLTDGFQDQFGGIRGKKYKRAQIRKIFLNNLNTPLKNQKNILDETLKDWMKNEQQVDDICTIGIEV